MSPENLVVCSYSVWKIWKWVTDTRKEQSKRLQFWFYFSPLCGLTRDDIKTRKNSDSSRGNLLFLCIYLFIYFWASAWPHETVMYVKVLLMLQNILQIWVPSSSSSRHSHTVVWKLSFQTITNQVTPSCTLLQPAATYTLKGKLTARQNPNGK